MRLALLGVAIVLVVLCGTTLTTYFYPHLVGVMSMISFVGCALGSSLAMWAVMR